MSGEGQEARGPGGGTGGGTVDGAGAGLNGGPGRGKDRGGRPSAEPQLPAAEPQLPAAEPQLPAIELDRAKADERSRQRLVSLHTRVIPVLRWVGFGLLTACCYVYNLTLGDPAWNERLPVFATACAVYCGLSWWLLWRYFERLLPLDLGFFFLTTDLLLQAWAIHITGADQSWLIALLLFRSADQVTAGSKPALFFAHAGTASYLLLMFFIVFVEGREIDWVLELSKTGVLYAGNLYIALTALESDRRRERTAAAIELSRRLIVDLEERTGELEAARRDAEAASVAKSEFMTNISHELRTPMNAVTGLLELLSLERPDPELRRRLDSLRSSADELSAVIDEVLAFSRLESAEVHIEAKPTSCHRILREIVRRHRHRAEAEGLQLDADVAPDVPAWVELDPARVRQVLTQLVDNSIKFTDSGSVTLRVRRDLSDDYDLVFSVVDTGSGFDENDLGELFEAFTQGDASLTRRHGGVGLGLAISRRLVELMGGVIGAGHTPGGGATFFFRLPAPRSEPATGTFTETLEARRARMLVVEDNPLNREVLVAMLESLGLEVNYAENGRVALDSLRDDRFDLVLMDCQMPVMDGYQATRELRRREGSARHTPVVAVTAHAMEGDRERCLAAGMDDYLPKPVTLDTLAGVVGRWVELR